MPTDHAVLNDDPGAIASAMVALARDAHRVLIRAADAPAGRRRAALAELQRRAQALRGRIGRDRLKGARLWLEALQRQVLVVQELGELSGRVNRLEGRGGEPPE